MATRKIPMRMCVSCREMKPKQQMLRVVKTPENEIKLDTTGKLNGRGAYICKNPECFKKAEKIGAFSHAFEQKVEREVYEKLSAELEKIL